MRKANMNLSLEQIYEEPDSEMGLMRLSRLVGITLKKPLAKQKELAAPSPITGASNEWWFDPDRFALTQGQGAWQIALVEALHSEIGREDPYAASLSTYAFVEYAQSERGLFGMLAIGIRQYLCNDPKARAAVEQAFQKIAKTGEYEGADAGNHRADRRASSRSLSNEQRAGVGIGGSPRHSGTGPHHLRKGPRPLLPLDADARRRRQRNVGELLNKPGLLEFETPRVHGQGAVYRLNEARTSNGTPFCSRNCCGMKRIVSFFTFLISHFSSNPPGF